MGRPAKAGRAIGRPEGINSKLLLKIKSRFLNDYTLRMFYF
jgi:hypothetical protein